MALPTIEQAEGVAAVALKSDLTVVVGDLIGFDGTDWVKADADARIAARYVAMISTTVAGLTIPVCRSGVLFDSDAPFTKGAAQYLLTTAGAFGETMPVISTTLTILQKVGVALSTERVNFDVTQRGPDILRVRAAYDPASLGAATARSDTLTIAGLLTTDVVRGGPIAAMTGTGWDSALVIASLDVSGANTLRERLVNGSAGALDGASANLDVIVERY